MGRLTAKQVIQNERECVARQQCDRNCAKCDIIMDAKDILSAYDHVLELLSAEEQGLFVRLPCKVGSPCWKIWQFGGEFGVIDWVFDYDDISNFGITVFLTREEAEAALAKEG